MAEWFDDDAFWTQFVPLLYGASRNAAVPAEVDGFIALTGLAPGSHVLDLCCGPGRHALALAQRGYRVTGVDRTQTYLDHLSRNASALFLPVETVQSDMRAFRREHAFDAALSAFTSFGYFDDPDDDQRVLDNVAASLKPGGVFVIDVLGRELVTDGFTDPWETDLAGGWHVVEEQLLERNGTWLTTRWTVTAPDGTEARWSMGYRLYRAASLVRRLQQAGLRDAAVFGGFDGSDYTSRSTRLVIRAVL